MAHIIKMPQLGNAMEEGEILAWCKHEGEQVHKGEALLEVMTDKSAMVVEATEDGILRAVLAGPGETVPIKQPIAIFGTASEPIEDLLSELSAAKAAASAHAQIGAVATIEDRPSESVIFLLQQCHQRLQGAPRSVVMTLASFNFADDFGLLIGWWKGNCKIGKA